MCGIVGFTGNRQAAPILLDGLSKLEYRGYDSAGLAVRDGEALAQVVKAKGRLSNLIEKTDAGNALKGTCGIGHTRWATHGEPSQTNAHPHVSGNCSCSGSGAVESEVVGVHNGIIENYTELKEKLLKHGYTFYSQTDTEVVIKLVDYYYKKYNLGPIDAIAKTMVRVRGSYALELMFRDYPGEIWVARKDSPMIIGIADGETYVASDVPAILKYTRNVYYIGNLEFAKLTPGEAHFYNLDGDEIEKQTTEIKWDAEAAEKGGFEHFMMKEIHEQPKAVQDTLNSVIKNGTIDLSSVEITEDEIKNFEQIYIVACGSAWHVGMAAQYVLEDIADIPVRVELASEFRYRKMPVNQKALVIVVSQSGETADTLAALRLAKEKGITTLAVVNVVGSSIAREADKVFYTLAGPEISVATTKGWKSAIVTWYQKFKESVFFRKLFLLAFVTSMILFRTLLNRNLWMNPLSDVMGGWGIWETVNGEQKLTTECIENVIMMVPFSAVVIWTFEEKIGNGWKKVLWQSGKMAFIFSISIEILQLLLRLGTFQLSDIFYNTLGGMIGGLMYCAVMKTRKRL